MNKPLVITIGLGLFFVLILFSTTFSVSFHEAAVKKRFGTPEDVVTDPGLRFKLPIFADQVTKYDTRLQLFEPAHETINTADGQQIVVRSFLLWRVDRDQVLKFDQHRSIDAASAYINDRFKSALLAGLGRYRFSDLIGPDSRLAEAEQTILSELEPLRQTGIEPVSVGISQVLFPSRTSRAVLTRMQATRETLARSERSKGQSEAQRIEAEARTMADRITTFASQRAAEIRAAGDKDAEIYIRQMGEEPDLALFLVYLDTLEAMLSERTTMILETGYAPMHLLNFRSPLNARGVPQPSSTYAGEPDREFRAAAGNPGAESSPYPRRTPSETNPKSDSDEPRESESDAERGN